MKKKIIITVILIAVLAAIIVTSELFIDRLEKKFTDSSEENTDTVPDGPVVYVSEKEDGLYLINRKVNNGEPLLGPATEIFIEHQDSYARFKSGNTYGIISCYTGEILLQGCSKILALPYYTVTGAAIKDGKVLIFLLPTDEDYKIKYEFEEFDDVEEVIYNEFVIVKKGDNYGVVSALHGNVVIPAEYHSISFLEINNDNNEAFFLCKESPTSAPTICTVQWP